MSFYHSEERHSSRCCSLPFPNSFQLFETMAGAILSSLLETIFGNLASSAMQELQQVWGVEVDKEIQNLKSTFSAIQAVLEDAEERQFESKAVQDWLQKLKEVAYDAEDLVDEIVTETRQSETAENGSKVGKKRKWVWDYFPSFLNSSQQDMACRIREINVRLDKIAKERRDLHLETRDGSKQIDIIRQRRRLFSSVRDKSSPVLGRINDAEEIVKSLLSDDSGNRQFSVIGIVGMGGVGKTTLAQVVYNDKRVAENFDVTAWVCVSEHFDVERLTKEIIASASESSCELSDIDSLQCCLRDKLNEKKFLVVLDDVWSENDSDWGQLQAPFTYGAKGSKIVVTTRSQAASNAMQAKCTLNLRGLSKQDCWSLFVSQAFKDENIDTYPDLLKIGEELMNRCGGLPLTAKALGGLLSSKRQAKEWENILKSPIWHLQGAASNILPALRLSYQHLPAHLKRCFTFCSVFPKDYEFRKEKLVQLWVANGFIHLKEGKKIEDTGAEYFNDLFVRSFFQLSSFNKTGEPVWYKMHDLFHDLAKFIAGDECFQMEHGKCFGVLGKTRHLLYTVSNREPINLEPFYGSKGLRTFLLMQNFRNENEKPPHEMFERLRVMRVLDLTGSQIGELPNSISNLKHLRYLSLSRTEIKELPGSICTIYTLQTLLLSSCRNLVGLPNEMRKLINLRHLDLQDCRNIASMPPQIGRLTCLQTLPWFVVGSERERGIAELKELTDICGRLEIGKLENVVEAEDTRLANLNNKPFINQLHLWWSENRVLSSQNEQLEEEIANGLQPHPNLQCLDFHNYMGVHFPSWMMKMDVLKRLSNLATLRLSNCKRCSILPPLGCLPSLSFIDIEGMDEVNQIGREVYGMTGCFPSLKKLFFDNMLKLEQWHESEEGDFPCFDDLQIWRCPLLTQIPSSYLTNLSIIGCERLVSLPLLKSLKNLRVDDSGNLTEWCDVGEADFPHLQKLEIRNCPKMMRWPSNLPGIVELAVSNCPGFEALPLLPSLCHLQLEGPSEGLLKSVSCLTSLSSLIIGDVLRLTSIPRGTLQKLTQLKDLKIRDCEELVTLLEENGLEDECLPSTLTGLSLYNCPKLKSLPRRMHALTSLQIMNICICPLVASFPEEGLPSALQTLCIAGCQMLKERCMKDTGEDWPKISHIPHVFV